MLYLSVLVHMCMAWVRRIDLEKLGGMHSFLCRVSCIAYMYMYGYVSHPIRGTGMSALLFRGCISPVLLALCSRTSSNRHMTRLDCSDSQMTWRFLQPFAIITTFLRLAPLSSAGSDVT